MMSNRYVPLYVLYILAGVALVGLGIAGVVDNYWSGMGSALMIVGILRIIRIHRMNRNETYRDAFETAQTDERLRFLQNRAWFCAGYAYVILIALASIGFRIAGQNQLSLYASYSLCTLLILYWGSYLILRKKY